MGLPLELPGPRSARFGTRPGVRQRGGDAAGATLGGLPLARPVTGQKTGTFQRRFTKKHQDTVVCVFWSLNGDLMEWSPKNRLTYRIFFVFFGLSGFLSPFLSLFVTSGGNAARLEAFRNKTVTQMETRMPPFMGEIYGIFPQNARLFGGKNMKKSPFKETYRDLE